MPEVFLRTFTEIEYIGSFPVTISDIATRAEYIRLQINELRANARTIPVRLVISLSGIKICSPDGKHVHMAHALRRISYATCDPNNAQFSFVAREPHGHCNFQYCHSFLGHSSDQAEELNVIVGNAFQMAYAAQLQRHPTPAFDGLGSQGQIMEIKGQRAGCPAELPPRVNNPSPIDVHISVGGSATSQSVKISHPDSIPGLLDHHQLNVENNLETPLGLSSCQSTPTSDESNSTTELNSYKLLMDKPPLIKKLTMGLASTPNGIPDDIHPLVPHSPARSDSNSSPPIHRKILYGGYVNEASMRLEKNSGRLSNLSVERLKQSHFDLEMFSLAKRLDVDSVSLSRSSQTSSDVNDFKSMRISHISSCSSSLGGPGESSTTTTPPPLPERVDSLAAAASSAAAAIASEEGELRAAPWFQAGIPREITLEVLSHEPIGAFMVRESTSKPGCYALSLRVPRDFQPSGIAHYLIMRTNKGFKIKGFTKEFSTLTALITHHSVMPELLPCPLSLNRYNPTFGKTDSSKDFADIDSDPDYNTLADFRKMMADLNV